LLQNAIMDLPDIIQLLEAMALMPDGDKIVVSKIAGMIDWHEEQPVVVKPRPSTRATRVTPKLTETRSTQNLTPIKEGYKGATAARTIKKSQVKTKPKPKHQYEVSSESESDGDDKHMRSTGSKKTKKIVNIDLGDSYDEDEYVVDTEFSQQAEYHDLVRG
jgi:hypothetical protein